MSYLLPSWIMMAEYFNITVIAEWITFFAAIILLDKRTGLWQLFILLMFVTLCAETIGWYMRTQRNIFDNALPFNILMIVSNVFFIWFFSKAKTLKYIKKLLMLLIYFFAVFATVNLIFFQGFWRYNSFSESLVDIAVVIICCYFLLALVRDNEHINLLSFDYFWLANGLLFYGLGSALLYNFSYLLREYYQQTKIDIGTYINYALNFILYTSFIIAFICRRKTTR
jgi:hypothetical protein